MPWDKERKSGKSSGGGAANEPLLPHADLRYYARGLFTSGTICNVDGVPGKTFLGKVRRCQQHTEAPAARC